MFYVTMREYEMGEDTFLESDCADLGSAHVVASNWITEHVFGSGDKVVDFHIVPRNDSDPLNHLEVTWTVEEYINDDWTASTDYILSIREEI